MTSRERLLTALRLGQPDRVPVTLYEMTEFSDHWATRDPSFQRVLKLQTELGDNVVFCGVDTGTGVGDPNTVTQSVTNEGETQVVETTLQTPKGPLTSIYRRDPGHMTSWAIKRYIESHEDLRRYLSMPLSGGKADPAPILAAQDRMGEHGLVFVGPGDPIGLAVGIMDFEFFAVEASLDPAPFRELTDRLFEAMKRSLEVVCPLVKDVCFRFWGPEYCGAPLVNPHRLFPEFVVRYDKELCRIVNESGNYSVIHCHGRLRDLCDYLIEIGPSALEPLEVSPNRNGDVTMAELKDKIGARMCLMGGIEGQDLELAQAEQLRERVAECIRDGAPGGGYVMLPTSAPFVAPLPEKIGGNIAVYFETANRLGRYLLENRC
ncbi:MAG TPA: uroporphyrinogen decarboxylase family protein [Candidatus Brocadiia bacterium]|nr:uroporphyrinogen decarboxylase family protein [Candidatus Brocadiia bacterium]